MPIRFITMYNSESHVKVKARKGPLRHWRYNIAAEEHDCVNRSRQD